MPLRSCCHTLAFELDGRRTNHGHIDHHAAEDFGRGRFLAKILSDKREMSDRCPSGERSTARMQCGLTSVRQNGYAWIRRLIRNQGYASWAGNRPKGEPRVLEDPIHDTGTPG